MECLANDEFISVAEQIGSLFEIYGIGFGVFDGLFADAIDQRSIKGSYIDVVVQKVSEINAGDEL